MKLEAQRSQLLVIDVQERLLPVISGAEEMIGNCARLIEGARLMEVPVLISEQYRKGLGPTAGVLREKAGNAPVMEKMHFSCLGDAAMAAQLAQTEKGGRSSYLLAGIEAHVCVAQTALDLKARGAAHVCVAADAVASRRERSVEIALDRLRQNGVEVVTTEMALFEWQEQAGGARFKQISQLVK